VNDQDDESLHDFIVVGRRAFDPDNKTGIEMPAKGGNPALTDENIYQIIAFLRTEADPSLLGSGEGEEASDSTAGEHDTHDASNGTPEGAVISDTVPTATTEPTASGPTAVPTATVVFVPRDFNPEEAYNLSCA